MDSTPSAGSAFEALSKHDSLVPEIYRLNTVFIAVTCLVIGVRIAVRVHFVKRVAVDDYLMILAGLFATAFSVMNIVGTRYGLGRHVWDLPAATIIENAKKVIQTLWICQVMYATALALAKLSIISSYHRIFPMKLFRIGMYTLSFLIISVWIVSILTTIFQCTPVEGAWNFTIPKKCISIMSVYYFSTAFSIVTDLLLCTLPLPLFWKLNLPVREKYIVSGLFMLGTFATVASAMKISTLHDVQNIDVTIGAVPTLNWSVVEVGTGIICACMPCLKPLFNRIVPAAGTRAGSRASSHAAVAWSRNAQRLSSTAASRLSYVPPQQHATIDVRNGTLTPTSEESSIELTKPAAQSSWYNARDTGREEEMIGYKNAIGVAVSERDDQQYNSRYMHR